MRSLCRTVLLTAVVLVSAVTASAAPIVYTHTGFGSGTIGQVFFGAVAPVPFTFTATGDTDNIASCGGTCIYSDNLTASVTIGALGTFQILTPTRYFYNTATGTVGLSRAGDSGADLFNGPFVPGWDLETSVGPIAGNGQLLQWDINPLIDTTGGVLLFNDGGTEAVFTAVVGDQPIPEPSTMLLLGVGLVAAARRLRPRG